MPQGVIERDDHKISVPLQGQSKQSMEFLISHSKLYTEGFSVPAVERYQREARQDKR